MSESAVSKDVQACPSPVLALTVRMDGSSSHPIRIPAREQFRIREIFENHEYATPLPASADLTVVDIGANVGVYALYAKIRHPKARIHCFEPAPASIELLSTNVGHLPDVTIHPVALSDQDGDGTLHIHGSNSGQSSLKFSGAAFADDQRVPVLDTGRAIDRIGLDRIDILKIDTEGCEVEILRSLGARLEGVSFVLVEYHSEADRRAIDALMDGFHAFGSRATHPGVGVVKYVHRSLVTLSRSRPIPGLSAPIEVALHEHGYRFAARYASGLNVLDVGCGAGHGAAILADSGAAAVTGIDTDEAAVLLATRLHRRDHLNFAVADLLDPGNDNRQVDFIVSVLRDDQEPEVLVEGAMGILKPGGALLAIVGNSHGLARHNLVSGPEVSPADPGADRSRLGRLGSCLERSFGQTVLYRQRLDLGALTIQPGAPDRDEDLAWIAMAFGPKISPSWSRRR